MGMIIIQDMLSSRNLVGFDPQMKWLLDKTLRNVYYYACALPKLFLDFSNQISKDSLTR